MLVEAWSRVRPPGWILRIVGPDEAGHRREVECEARRLGVSASLDFAGNVSGAAKDDVYKGAELLILPSYTENFGMVVAEALAHSLPVLTTTGTPWEMLPTRGCGWWVEPTVDQIAGVLAVATALDAGTLREMGEKGRVLVSTDFTWRQTADKLGDVYRWLAGVSGKPEWMTDR